MSVSDTDQIVTSVGTTQIQYSVLELKARLGEYAMLAHTLNEALVKEAGKRQQPAAPDEAAPGAPADLPAALAEIPLPEDEQAKLREAFGLPPEARLSAVESSSVPPAPPT